MKVVIVNGQSHKGTTEHIARMVAQKISEDITEYFLPKDFSSPCIGCTKCFMDDETKCPHYEAISPITRAIEGADVIILASPVYVYHCTGAMKTWLDHYGYQWMAHRPKSQMFTKQAVVIATAAGAGMKTAMKDMTDSLSFWGISHIYKIGMAVFATKWDGVTPARIEKIQKKTDRIARQIKAREGHIKPSFKTKITFEIMRFVTLKISKNKPDVDYFTENGWDRQNRPWKIKKNK